MTISKIKRKTPKYTKAFTKTCPSCLCIFQCVRSTAVCCSRLCSMTNWRKNNVEKQNTYFKNLYDTSPERRIATCIRSRVNKALKGAYKQYSVTKNLGCSPADLIKHLEAKFDSNMSWGNYGNGNDKWNVDHIVPLSVFNLQDPTDFAKACHYSNLQPMWQPENCAKGNKHET